MDLLTYLLTSLLTPGVSPKELTEDRGGSQPRAPYTNYRGSSLGANVGRYNGEHPAEGPRELTLGAPKATACQLPGAPEAELTGGGELL